MERPRFEHIKSGKEFNKWYWLKEEMVDICVRKPMFALNEEVKQQVLFWEIQIV